MDPKQILKNKSLCYLPWTGFILEPTGNIKNCVLSTKVLGNIKNETIDHILLGDDNIQIKKQMLDNSYPKSCSGCYLQEQNKNSFDIISSRIYYTKELKSVGTDVFDNLEDFSLHHVDLRWTNQCNQACVYCDSTLSSQWAKELGVDVKIDNDKKQKVKDFVFKNVKKLKNVYLAGGEPLLMNENKEFLELLKKHNPDVHLRINTNLSHINTSVYKLITEFKNVHWTVSVESIEEQYDYIRYRGSWKNFLANLKNLQELNHKISFNMLYFILNYKSLFNCIDFLKGLNFHNNSFVVGPLYKPEWLNVLNLPDNSIVSIKKELRENVDKQDHLLKNGFSNILEYLETPFKKNIEKFKKEINIIDERRNLDSKKIFPELFEIL